MTRDPAHTNLGGPVHGMSSGRSIRELLDASSLGTSGARELVNRTPADQAAPTKEIAALATRLRPVLHHRVAHDEQDPSPPSAQSRNIDPEDLRDLWRLGQLYSDHHMNVDAQRCFLTAAELAMTACAEQATLQGDEDGASLWNARSQTLRTYTPPFKP